MTADTLERTDLEARREELLGHLATALQLERDAKFKAGMDDAFIPEMEERSEQVRRIQRQLEGLDTGFEKLTALEQAVQDAEDAARRREAAIALHSVMQRRFWALGKIQSAYSDLYHAIKEAERLSRETHGHALQCWALGDDVQDSDQMMFLMNIGAVGRTDVVATAKASLAGFDFDIGSLGAMEDRALNAMAKALPEVLEPEVREAGGEDALKRWKAAQDELDETPGQ